MISRSVRRRLAIGQRLVLSWRPTGLNLAELLRTMITSFIALGATFWILPGEQTSGPVSVLLLVVTVVGVGLVVRPLLAGFAVLTGPVGLLLVGLLAQGVILDVAISIAPDVRSLSYLRTFMVSLIAAAVAALVNWLLDAGSADSFLAQALGRVVRVTHRLDGQPGMGEPGMLVIQLDGVGLGVLRQAIVAGAVPTLARWMREGTHRGYGWHTGLPATTPAGQAVLLHGDTHAVPSFRWFEKETGTLLVANRPADAQIIQQRFTSGRGLLADGGVSVSNLFSGDAPTRVLTMSDARLPDRRTRGLASFAASLGFLRTVVVFMSQVVLEIYQARRQRRRDVRPRVERGGVFALLRGVTAALLHDLNVTIVAEQMARGAPVIFVDFVDYDEVAHHAGPTRPESVRTLDGLDRVLRFFEEVATETNRHYEIVVVSDHGQSQGEPFAQLVGRSLDDVVSELVQDSAEAGASPAAATAGGGQAERWGPANLLLTSAARSRGAGIGSLARRKADGDGRQGTRDGVTVSLGRTRVETSEAAPFVASSGSLAHIYLPTLPGRATRQEISRLHPRLLEGLAAYAGIGLVLVRCEEAGGPVVIGARGWRSLATPDASVAGGGAGVNGEDPLEQYGPRAAGDLLDLDAREHVGDLVVLGRYDVETGEVAAFEELVGSHGGLGGDQTEAVFIVPTTWPGVEPLFAPVGNERRPSLTGREVHDALVRRLRQLGLRPGDDLAADVEPGAGSTAYSEHPHPHPGPHPEPDAVPSRA